MCHRAHAAHFDCFCPNPSTCFIWGGPPPRQNKKWKAPDKKNDWGSWNSIKTIIGMHSRIIGAIGPLPIKTR